jgi:1,4-dihydroxy-2-naphthoyl-CoA synthase
MTTTAAELAVEGRGPVLWLTIQWEDRRNAMSHGVLDQRLDWLLTGDAKEGRAAFQQKRKPGWRGR